MIHSSFSRIPQSPKLLSLLLIALGFTIFFTGCGREQKGLLQRLMATTASQYEGEKISEEKVAEMERHVRLFSDEVRDLVKKRGRLGIYYRMLAMKYLDEEMYGPALDNFANALEIYPNNHILHYYSGVAKSQLAKTVAQESARMAALEEAAHYYERAVELKGNYADALYALSVLYIFELDRVYEAEPYVQKLIGIRSDHYRAKFLLARIRLEQNRAEEAVEIYTEIAEEAPQEEMVERARENRERVMRGEYGN